MASLRDAENVTMGSDLAGSKPDASLMADIRLFSAPASPEAPRVNSRRTRVEETATSELPPEDLQEKLAAVMIQQLQTFRTQVNTDLNVSQEQTTAS